MIASKKPKDRQGAAHSDKKPIRVTIATETTMHTLLSTIAEKEEVHPNKIVRAMVKAGIVEWLKHTGGNGEFSQEVKGFMTNGRL